MYIYIYILLHNTWKASKSLPKHRWIFESATSWDSKAAMEARVLNLVPFGPIPEIFVNEKIETEA